MLPDIPRACARPSHRRITPPSRPRRNAPRSRYPSSVWDGSRGRRYRCPCRYRSRRAAADRPDRGRRPRSTGRSMLVCRPVNAVVSRISSARAGDQHLLVSDIGHALARGDEFGAHIGEVAAERLAPRASAWPSVMPPASTNGPSKNARTARTNTKGLSQPVWPPAPAVSSTSPSAPAATARSAWRIEATSANTSAPASCSGPITGAGEPTEVITISGRCRSSTCRSCSSRALERCTIRFAQTGADGLPLASACACNLIFDLRQPFVELFGTAAIHRRERADHAVAAGGDHKVDAGDEKHRCRDQRQAEAVAKARERIDCWQSRFFPA